MRNVLQKLSELWTLAVHHGVLAGFIPIGSYRECSFDCFKTVFIASLLCVVELQND